MSIVTGKINPVSSDGNKDTQRDIFANGTDIRDDNKSREQTQTQDTRTLKPSLLTRQECVKNGSRLTPNVNAADSSDVMQEQQTSVSPSRMKQTSIGPVYNERHGEQAFPSKAPVNKYFHNVSSSAVSVEDPTQVPADPVNSKAGPKVDFTKVHVSREDNDKEQSICSQSTNTSTVNPNISRRSLSQLDSQNEAEEIFSHNDVSQDNQSFSSNPRLSTRYCGTKNSEEGTSAPEGLSSLVQREHKQANAGMDKSRTALSKTHIKPALHGLLTTSININDAKNDKLGLEPPSAQKLSQLNTRSSPASSTGLKIVPNHVVLKSSNDSDSMQGTRSKDGKILSISQLTGRRTAKLGIRSPKPGILQKESVEANGSKGTPVTTSRIPTSVAKGKSALLSPSITQKESVLDPKAPTMLKHIMGSPAVRKSPQIVPELGNQTILGSGAPKASVDNEISSVMACEMGDISDLELPALLENDGNVEKAEACRKELEDICILLKRKHDEAKELAVRAIINNNMMLMLNHPMFEEKISSLQKFANTLRSKKYIFEEVGAIDSHGESRPG